VELAQLRNRVDAALIMVTHDQAEAMTLADRIAVNGDRTIQQVGTPAEVYARPANAFVARFVGSAAMAMLPVEVAAGGADGLRVRLPGGAEVQTAVRSGDFAQGQRAELGLRPEHVTLAVPGSGGIPASASDGRQARARAAASRSCNEAGRTSGAAGCAVPSEACSAEAEAEGDADGGMAWSSPVWVGSLPKGAKT
jgi:ABC-type sugar transport system ATPase subunit